MNYTKENSGTRDEGRNVAKKRHAVRRNFWRQGNRKWKGRKEERTDTLYLCKGKSIGGRGRRAVLS